MDKSIFENNTPKEALLITYVEGQCSDLEKDFVEKWLKEDVRNEEVLTQLSKIYFAYQAQQNILKRDTISSYYHVKKKIDRKKRTYQLKESLFAAACLIAVISTLSTTYLLVNDSVEKSVVRADFDLITVESKVGMRSNFHLPDGSLVYLNSGGSISYPTTFEKHERRISLNGEAYFKIKSDAGHPFFVDLPKKNVAIKVLGTEFNLEAYGEESEIRATLLSGRINILLSDKYRTVAKEYELSPFQKAEFNTQSEIWKITNTDGVEEIAWMQGKLIFNNTPLPEVLRGLSHFYDVDFKIENRVISTYRFTGVFDNRQLIQVLDYLKISSSIDYTVKQFDPQEEAVKKRTVITLKKI